MNRTEQNTDFRIIQTIIEDYSNFMDSLEEISVEMGLHRDLPFLQSLYHERMPNIEREYLAYKNQDIPLTNFRDDALLADILLAMIIRAHAKIGDISVQISSDLGFYEKQLDESIHAMECHEASEHFEDYMNSPEGKNHFANMYGTMLTPEESREPDDTEYPHDNTLPDGTHQCDCDVLGTCPFNAYGSDDCRRYCGLGVDE